MKGVKLTRFGTGIQLHPEISHTARGTEILGNFALKVCGARADWEMENFTEKEIIRIRKLVGENAQVVSSCTIRFLGGLLNYCRLALSPAVSTAR